MAIRLPLYAKISIWFFLNLVALAVVFALIFNAQFNLNLNWLLASGARERLEAVRDLIVGELNVTAPDDWPEVLERYSQAHRVQFALLDDEARPLVGDIGRLPAEVRARVLTRVNPPAASEPGAPVNRPHRSWPGPPLRAIVRTAEPRQYWLLASARLDNPQAGEPMRVVLLARSSSISGGGLIFDPNPWLALGLGAVVFSLLFWLPLVRGITRSVAEMTQATRQIADGRFDVRVNERRRDELGALGEAIDQMAVRLDGFLTGQKRFLGDIAHELCSPLARLQMALGILEQRATEVQSPYVQSATDKAEQMAVLVAELLTFSKATFGASAVRLEPTGLRAAALEAIRRETTETADFQFEAADELLVTADPELLTRAIANLLRNAQRHAGAAGPITVQLSATGGEATLSVADCGPGVPETELTKIFDAFYRVDTSRMRETGGSGLGLAIVKACVDSCLGTVSARNRVPHGLDVRIQLSIYEL